MTVFKTMSISLMLSGSLVFASDSNSNQSTNCTDIGSETTDIIQNNQTEENDSLGNQSTVFPDSNSELQDPNLDDNTLHKTESAPIPPMSEVQKGIERSKSHN